MPPLDNPRHEAFAQELFRGLTEGRTRAECYSRAGYTKNPNSASADSARLLNASQHIIERVRELQEQAAASADVTVQTILAELEEARRMSREQKQGSAMTAASMGKAKIVGLDVHRVEQGRPGDFSGLRSKEDLAEKYLIEHGATNITEEMRKTMVEELERHCAAVSAIAHTGSDTTH